MKRNKYVVAAARACVAVGQVRRGAKFGILPLVLVMCTTFVALPAKPAEASLLWLLVPLFENALNRKATEPMDRSTSECRVTANATWCGKTYGMQFDLTKWVIGVRAGAVVNLDAVLVGKPGLLKMVAAEIFCDDPDFRPLKAVAMPPPDRRGTRRICPDTLYVTESGCIFPVDTHGMDFKGYTLQVKMYFNNGKKQAGFFGTERIPYSDSTMTLVQLVVMDDQQIAQSVNNPEIQRALQYSFGLQPTIPQLGPANIPVSDEIAAEQQLGNFAPQPTPQPAQSYTPPATQPTPPSTPTYQSPPQSSMQIPPLVQRWMNTLPQLDAKRWLEPQSWQRPNYWQPKTAVSTYIFFINSSGRILSGPLNEDNCEVRYNGVLQGTFRLNCMEIFTDVPSDGLMHFDIPAYTDVELHILGGPTARFRTTGASTVQWQPIRVQ